MIFREKYPDCSDQHVAMKREAPNNHPIFNACLGGDAATVSRFLSSGIDPYANGVITDALRGGNVGVMEAFLDHGFDISKSINIHGETPIFRVIEMKQMAILVLLVEKGADIHDRPMGGGTVLHKAAALWPEGAAFLLDAGADVNAKATDGKTPLMSAAFGNQLQSMELLLAAGADLEAKNNEGTTALISAARAGKAEAVGWLLDHGADILTEDKEGKSAEDWAKENGHAKIVELLQSHMGS